MPGKSSPFSPEQRIWIVTKYAELKSTIAVRRAFCKEFKVSSPSLVPRPWQFKRVIEKFNDCGDIGDPKPKLKPGANIPPGDIQAVEDFFDANKEAHLKEASLDLGMSVGKIWFILRKVLKWRAYVPKKATALTLKQKQTRQEAARWFLLHDPDFFSSQVIWTDEKYFVLKQGPNRQIDRYWAPVNPHRIVECKTQSQQKVMCWTGLCDGKVLGPFWIEGTMDQYVYNELLENKVWPIVKNVAARQQLWFMQDGARCHTTQLNLQFLQNKFHGRVISNLTDIPWPPNSPDLNPLDFFFLGSFHESCFSS